jgi:single-strand DNA-binding protein
MKNEKNSVRLVGHVGQVPRIFAFDSGKKKAVFTLATNERFKDAQGEWQSDTQWHQLVAWGKEAEYIEKHVSKGTELSIEGKLKHRNYQDKSGTVRYITEILMLGVEVMEPKSKAEGVA